MQATTENPIRGAVHGVWMSLILWGIIGSIVIMLSGCASLQGGNPVEVQALPGGAAVGVNPTMLDQAWAWVKDNPKSAVIGLGTGIYGGYKLSQQNNWFGLGKHDESPAGVNTTTTLTHEKSYTVNVGNIGNDSTVVIYQVSPQTSTAQ